MGRGYKLYRTKDFIRKSEAGTIDIHRSLELVRELAEIADFHQDSNIVIDLKDTTGSMGTNELLQAALEFAQYKNIFKNKIAVLMPIDEDRLARAKIMHRAMDSQGFQFNYFTDFEDAIDWLSIVVDFS
jgi:hypothetical protein